MASTMAGQITAITAKRQNTIKLNRQFAMTDVKQQENTVTAVSLQGVSHTYGQVRALNNIHLSIPKSVTVGLIGPDGV